MKRIAKLAVGLVTAATMAVSMAGLATNAAVLNHTTMDDYSMFQWGMNSTEASVSLKNTSGSSRYVSVHVSVYARNGAYVSGDGKSGVLANKGTYSKTITPGKAFTGGYFSATMYTSGTPHGTPLSDHVETLGTKTS